LLAGIDADRAKTVSFDFAFPEVPGLPVKGYDKINILDPEKYTARTDMPEATATNRKETPVNRYGVYVQDMVKLSAKLNLLAGVRWSYVANKGLSNINLANGSSEQESNLDNSSFSPRFGLVYKPLPSTSVFASYATSFIVNNGTDIYNNALEPSIIDQYEAGIKNELFNGKLSANLTLYRIRNNNLAQTAEFNADGLPNYDPALKTLAGETTSDGIEIDLASHPATGLDILAGYSYNYMRYTNIADRPGNYKEGERLVNNPSHTANASVFYNFEEPALKGLKAGITAFYVGERFGGWNNKIDQAQNYSRLIPVSGYTTIDISAGYSYRKASVLLKVSNVTNVYNYYVHENYSINPIPPRQLMATVSYKF
jgi:iron complex outermembrane receptor protein